jgi:hypothetical protein
MDVLGSVMAMAVTLHPDDGGAALHLRVVYELIQRVEQAQWRDADECDVVIRNAISADRGRPAKS